MMRKPMATAFAIAVAASTASLIASPAVAAGENPYDTFDAAVGAPAGAIVGVGSDTTQIVVHAVSEAYNETHTPKLASFAADGPPANVTLRQGGSSIQRSVINGSGNGKKTLFGTGNNPDVDFARSSSSNNSAETSAGLQQAAFAVDGMKMAVSAAGTNAPATLSPSQVVDIYKGVTTNWNQIGGTSGVIKPRLPQSGSGTYSFFLAKLQEANGGQPVTMGPAVTTTQEHSPTEIQGDPNAIGPFSTARALGIPTIGFVPGTEWQRAVYNVVRGAELGTKPLLNELFGPDGYFCSAEGRAAIRGVGFRPLATVAGGGKCGVFTQAAVTDFTSHPDTSTVLYAAPTGGGKAKLTATIVGGVSSAGTVTFTEGGTTVGAVAVNSLGQAVLELSGLTAGTHQYKATFAPSNANTEASESVVVAVDVPAAGAFEPVSPARVLDTRPTGGGAVNVGAPPVKVAANTSVSFQVAGTGAGVPTDAASAVVLNVAVTGATAGGFITAHPSDQSVPTAANLNFVAGQSLSNHVTVKLGPDGKASLFNGSSQPVHLIADVNGWYVSGTASEPGTFTPMSPKRVLDTRPVPGQIGPLGKVPGQGTIDFTVAGVSPIPASDVGAGVFNIAVTGPTAAGFITGFPKGVAKPTAANLNYSANQTASNAATIKLGDDGKVSLFNGQKAGSDAHYIADANGWFRAGAAEVAGAFTPLAPARILDTRPGTTVGAPAAKVAAGASVTLTVAGAGGVPGAGAGAVVFNLAVTNDPAAGFITAHPADVAKPTAANLNFAANKTISNLVTVKLSDDGKVKLFNGSSQSIDLIADVAGWYKK